jgi:hypothetical protein
MTSVIDGILTKSAGSGFKQAHTDYICSRLLGMSQEEMEILKEKEVFR